MSDATPAGAPALDDPRFRATLAPDLTSWYAAANDAASDFPLQNLPVGTFATAAGDARVGVALGDAVIDVRAGLALDLFDGAARTAAEACDAPAANRLLSLGRGPARALRLRLVELFRDGDPPADAPDRDTLARLLRPIDAVALRLPAEPGDYTDFYASVHHATNVGSLFRPDNPLLPNYKWVPIGYHGRASSIVPSGTPVRRPSGQRKGPDDAAPSLAPSRAFDYELELGAWVGAGNALGTPVPLAEADAHLFGVSLLNDWSARDLQAWEYQPLGPFLAKNFASTVSPWIVTLDALEPFRAPLAPRADGDPAPLPYLDDATDRARGGIGLTLEVTLRTPQMREAGEPAARLSRGRALDLYWSFGQMLAHHTVNGCNLRAGDLLGSGTVSGPAPESRGCLLELTRRAAEPVTLPNGETRGFLQDGDEVALHAWAEADGARRIGFGPCVGTVLPAH